MVDPSAIQEGMPVIGSDGETLGQVDAVEGGTGGGQDGRIKLKRDTSPDGQHHFVPLSEVERIDEHIHLTRKAADVRSGWMTMAGVGAGAAATGVTGATAATTPTTVKTDHGARDIHVEKDRNWLPYILGALALLALLVFGLRSCDGAERTAVVPAEPTAAAPVATEVDVAEQRVPLPGGGSAMLASGTIGYELQRFLASADPVPRTFQFDRLNFDTAKANIRAIDRPTIEGLGQIMTAYPNARVRVVGYADARGDAAANANLGLNRAKAVAAALTGAGTAANRIETATGGEANATDTNSTTQGQAENRRTELVVLAK